MNLRENQHNSVYSQRTAGLVNDPAPVYMYENNQDWVPLPVIPTAAQNSIQEKYDMGGEESNRNAYAGSDYDPPNVYRDLESRFAYQFPEHAKYYEYYNFIPMDPIDLAYQISRQTNCMGGAPRLPGLLPCPYGTDAIACASRAA